MGEKDLVQKSLEFFQLTEREEEEGIGMCKLLDKYWNGGVAEGLSDGFVGFAEYVCEENEAGTLVLLENRRGVRNL